MTVKETYYLWRDGRFYWHSNGYNMTIDRNQAKRIDNEQEAYDECPDGYQVVKVTTTVTIEETMEVL